MGCVKQTTYLFFKLPLPTRLQLINRRISIYLPIFNRTTFSVIFFFLLFYLFLLFYFIFYFPFYLIV
jgi:hypothetical protein